MARGLQLLTQLAGVGCELWRIDELVPVLRRACAQLAPPDVQLLALRGY
jgi:hypothetical protein